jgi:hypothetical protein
VSYAKGTDPDQGPHSFMDGVLHLWPNGWLVLRDHMDTAVIGRYCGSDESINVGAKALFSTHFARILRSDMQPCEVRPPIRENSDPN